MADVFDTIDYDAPSGDVFDQVSVVQPQEQGGDVFDSVESRDVFDSVRVETQKVGAKEIGKTAGQSLVSTGGNVIGDYLQGSLELLFGGDPAAYARNPRTQEKLGELAERGVPISRKDYRPIAFKAGRDIASTVKSFTPEDWATAQEAVRAEAGEDGVNFFKLGAMMLADNSGNMLASMVNPAIGFQAMFSNERNSMGERVISSGMSPELADKYSSIYASISAPIEYMEIKSRVHSAFGGKKKALLGSIGGKLKTAGINVTQEVLQEIVGNVVYNEAIKEHNELTGDNLPGVEILDEMGNVVNSSVAMSVILEALGLGGKGVKKVTQKILPSGEVQTQEVKLPRLSQDEHIRLNELKKKPALSQEERSEFDVLVKRLGDKATTIEQSRLRSDVNSISMSSPFALHPKDITRETTESELADTLDALEAIYGYRPDKKQVIDAFVEPMMRQRVETEDERTARVERETSELRDMLDKKKKGDISTDEFIAFMEDIDPDMAESFIERTTGENQEKPLDVINDLIKQQEVQDGSVREPQATTEQREATEQQQERVPEATTREPVQEPGQAEDQQVEQEAVEPAVEPTTQQDLQSAMESDKTDVTGRDKVVGEALAEEGIAPPEVVVLPPNPQLPFARWYQDMMKFAVREVQIGRSRAEFVSDMEGEYLHYEATSDDLADIWNDAKVEAKRIADIIKAAEKKSAKARITQKQFKDTETQEVKASTLINELMRVQQRASKQGRRAAIAEIKERVRGFRTNAKELVSEFRDQMKMLNGATKLEKSNLRNAIKDIQLARTPDAQEKAFNKAVDLLAETVESIDARTPRYEYVPFPEAETESGVDKNSRYEDIRQAFVGFGGSPEVRSTKEMLRFLNGTKTGAPTRLIVDDINAIKSRFDRQKKSPALRRMNRVHQSGLQAFRYNMFDMLGILSRGAKDSNLMKIRDELARSERAAGFNRMALEEKAAELNPKGKYTSKVMNTSVKVDTPNGKMKMGLGEIIMIDMSLENRDNINALVNNDFLPDKAKQTFRATEQQYRDMVDQAMDQISPATKEAYDKSKDLYAAIVDMSGDMITPTANAVMEDLGMERGFKKVDGKYVPIVLADVSDAGTIEIDIPDGTGGVEVQRIDDNFINREIHQGKFKERTGGSRGGRIRVGNLDSVLSHIMDNAAEFSAKGIVNNDLLKLLNNRDLKTEIHRTFGKKFAQALYEKATQTTGTMKTLQRTGLDRGISKMFSLVDPYRLSRISTGAIMASSAQMVRPFLNNSSSFGLGLKHALNPLIQEKIKEDGFTYSRYSGRAFSPELAEQGAKIKTRSGGGTGETRASKFISWGDKGAISTVYAATAFDEMLTRGTGNTIEDLKKQDDAFWDAVGDRVAYETMRTQPSGTSAAVSAWKGRARSNTFWRIITRYGSQGSRIYNNVVDALDQYVYEPSDANRTNLNRVLEAQVLTNTAILSAIKATRRTAKTGVLVMLASLMGKDDDEIEELKKKRGEEVDKILPSFFANYARTSLRTIEGVDDLMSFYDFLSKKYVDDPGFSIIDSELRDLKDAVQAYKTALKWHEILETGKKEKTVRGSKMMVPISPAERKQAENSYLSAVERITDNTKKFAMIMSRMPMASLEDVDLGEDMIAEKIVKLTTEK